MGQERMVGMAHVAPSLRLRRSAAVHLIVPYPEYTMFTAKGSESIGIEPRSR